MASSSSIAATGMTPLTAFRLTDGQPFEQIKSIDILDQLLLPHDIQWEKVQTIQQAFDAIKSMKIRGAPAIASLASLGIAAELLRFVASEPTPAFHPELLASSTAFLSALEVQVAYLLSSRPTAVNLLDALNRITAAAESAHAPGKNVIEIAKSVIGAGIEVWSEDRARNVRIGDHGAAWIIEKLEREGVIEKGEKINVLTVCNTGSLATSGYGTALGVITSLHLQDRCAHAYYAQTGPYQQGARLTSMELASIGVENTMVCDTAIGSLLTEKRIHLFVAGADRIASNGDSANKISTYQIASLCSSPHPFSPNPATTVLIAAPITTFDLSMESGREIVIEQRPGWEACTVRGRVVDVQEMAKNGCVAEDGRAVEVTTVLVTPMNTRAYNPAFDVTPACLIDGIVTEEGGALRKEDGQYDLRSFVLDSQK